MTIKSALQWTFISAALRYLIKLSGNLALARLLTPEDFGLSAIVLAVVTGLETITDMGAKPALIRSGRSDAAWLDTAWTLGLIRGVAVGAAVALAAGPIAWFFGHAQLGPMIAATGTMSVLVGLTSISAVVAVRDLQLKNLAIAEIATAAAGYAVMIAWAWLAPSAWALLSGAVSSTALFTIASFFIFKRRPARLRWDRAVLNELIGFGKWVLLASLLGFVIFQGDRFSVAKLVGVGAAGLYSIAITWALSLQAVFGMFIQRLYLPVSAQLWRGSAAYGAQALSLRRSLQAAMIVPYGFAAGCAPALIAYLYPPAYLEAGPLMAILVVGAWFATLEFIYNDQLMVLGEPAWRFLAQTISVLLIGAGLAASFGAIDTRRIAIIFSAAAALRAAVLLYACERAKLRRMIPDLALTALFGLLAGAVSGASHMLTTRYSALAALILCLVTLAPIGMAIAWRVLPHILRLASEADKPATAAPQPATGASAPLPR